MTTTQNHRGAAADALSRWRAQTPAEKRAARRRVVVTRIVTSMAMENEPVSMAWVQQATTRRTA